VKALVIVEGPLRAFFDRDTMEKFAMPLRGDNYPQAFGRVIDGMTKPIQDSALRDKIKTLMLKTPQHVAVSEFKATADEELWKPDKINVPMLMILAKQPASSAEYEQFVRNLIPKLDYQIWPDVSHFLMMEKPREFNATMLKFLEQNQFLDSQSRRPAS
jgi:pimeloyl-ACP methyl ester carboxylesterase